MAFFRKINAPSKYGATTAKLVAPILIVGILLTFPIVGYASGSAPILNGSNWKTGGFYVDYTATVGGSVNLYISTDNVNFSLYTSWSVDPSGSGTYEVSGLKNEVTYYFYINETMPDGTTSDNSEYMRQTPPITAYIINWPQMLADLNNMFNNFFTLSPDAENNLQAAVDGLKNSAGAGSASAAGSDLKNAFDNLSGYSSAASGDLAFQVTIIDSKYGSVKPTLFDTATLDKLTWLATVRAAVVACLWIMFVFWLVARFTPFFKV